MKYRKKPVVIEAVQFDGENADELIELAPDQVDVGPNEWGAASFSIHTLEGTMTGQVNDWLIKGVKGEFYPCKPDIFEATYEAADG